MAAKLRPRGMLPRSVSSTATARPKPAAASFSGVLDGRRLRMDKRSKLIE